MGYIEELLMDLIMQTVCPRCEAGPQHPCTTVAGKRADVIHTSRIDPLKEAYSRGRGEVSTTHLPPDPADLDIHA